MRPRVGRALRAVAVWLGEHSTRCEAASVRLWYLARAYETGGLRGVVRSGWATPRRGGGRVGDMTDTARLALLHFHGRALLAALPRCRCGALATRQLDTDPDPPDSPACDLHAGHPDCWPELPHAASARAFQAALDAPAGPGGPVG